jgi:hypothetical protein
MRFVCLGYAEEKQWESMSKPQQEAMMEECFAYDDELRRNGHWLDGGGALQSTRTAKTLRRRQGKLLVTDGPFAETKEHLGGFGVLEARDMDQAVELMSKHPGVRIGPFEIRPIDEEIGEHVKSAADSLDSVKEGIKTVCLLYGDENAWSAMSTSQRTARIEQCISYAERTLQQHGQSVGGAALQNSHTAKTLRAKGRKVVVTDGPFAETKEQLGGLAVFRFRDMETAVEAWSNHPCVAMGDTLEIRPADEEIEAVIEARWSQIECVPNP